MGLVFPQTYVSPPRTDCLMFGARVPPAAFHRQKAWRRGCGARGRWRTALEWGGLEWEDGGLYGVGGRLAPEIHKSFQCMACKSLCKSYGHKQTNTLRLIGSSSPEAHLLKICLRIF